MSIPVSLSGNEITDAVRLAALQGDGLSPESSMGIWDLATNRVVNGGFEVNANNWTLQGSATIVRTTTQSKFGVASLQVNTNGVGTGEGAGQTGNKTAVSISTQYTISMWVLAPAGATLRLTMKEYLAGVFVRDTGFTNFTGNGAWQRVVFTGTTGVAINGVDPRIATITSNQAITFYVDGVQIEQYSLATPYIDTNGSSVSRNYSRVQIPSGSLDETQSWIAIRVRFPWISTSEPYQYLVPFIWSDDPTHFIQSYFDMTADLIYIDRGSVSSGGIAKAISWSAGDYKTLIFSWSATLVGVSVDGSVFTTIGNTTIPVLGSTTINVMSSGVSTQYMNADCFWFAMGTGTLSDNDAKIINSFGNSDRNPSEFPGACTAVWQGRDNYALVPGDQGPLKAPFAPAGRGATW